MLVMNLRHYLSILVLLLATTACDALPETLAEQHLDLLKSGKSDEALKQYCNPKYAQELKTVKSFKIERSKSEQSDRYPRFDYTTVYTEVESDQFPQKKVTVSIDVWKSDDFYEDQRQSVSKPLSTYSRNPETRKRGGEAYEANLPQREDFNRDRQCVTVFVLNL